MYIVPIKITIKNPFYKEIKTQNQKKEKKITPDHKIKKSHDPYILKVKEKRKK